MEEIITIDSDDESGPGAQILYDDEYCVPVVQRIHRMLLMQYVPENPRTFNQDGLRSQLVWPLIERKGYLIKRAHSVESSDKRWGTVLSKMLSKIIPEKNRGKGALKANASKAQLVDIVSQSWTVFRKIYEHSEGKLSREAEHELQMYIYTLSELESDCIAAIAHETNRDVNKESLPVPRNEKDSGFDPKLVPEPRFRHCASCKLKTVNYASNYKAVQKERREITDDYLKISKQFQDSKKDPSVMAPTNKKGKTLTKPPEPPKLPPVLLICKGSKMRHEHGRGGYKCPTCTDRSCEICLSKCMFVCTTE